jgi:hypothetical protein
MGWKGPMTKALAQSAASFTLTDMFAQAATGKMTTDEAVKWAVDQYKGFVAKGL